MPSSETLVSVKFETYEYIGDATHYAKFGFGMFSEGVSR